LEKYTVHGDYTLENILIKNDDIKIIDPNPEVDLPVRSLDWAKLYQSLHSGYELYFSEINNSESQEKMHHYFKYIENYIHVNYGVENVLRTKFMEAIHLIRLLPYQVNSGEETWSHFFFLGLKRLNEFITEVEKN